LGQQGQAGHGYGFFVEPSRETVPRAIQRMISGILLEH
jgi:hypothetical protein